MALGSSHPSLELDFSSQMGWSREVILDQGPGEIPPFSPSHRGTASFQRLLQQSPYKSIHATASMLGREALCLFFSPTILIFYILQPVQKLIGTAAWGLCQSQRVSLSPSSLCAGSLELGVVMLAGPVRGRDGTQWWEVTAGSSPRHRGVEGAGH